MYTHELETHGLYTSLSKRRNTAPVILLLWVTVEEQGVTNVKNSFGISSPLMQFSLWKWLVSVAPTCQKVVRGIKVSVILQTWIRTRFCFLQSGYHGWIRMHCMSTHTPFCSGKRSRSKPSYNKKKKKPV